MQAAPSSSSRLGVALAACTVLYAFPVGFETSAFGAVPIYDMAYAVIALFSIAWCLPLAKDAWHARRAGQHAHELAAIALAAMGMTAALLRHPSWHSLLVLTELFGAVAIAVLISRGAEPGLSNGFIRTIAVFVTVQFGVGTAQVLRNGAVLGRWAAETDFGFRRISGLVGASGTMTFANVLGVMAAVFVGLFLHHLPWQTTGVDRLLVIAATTMSSALVGLSISRTAMIVWVFVIITAVASRDRRSLAVAVGLAVVALTLSVGMRFDGWASRGKASVAGVEQSGSGRMALNRQAIDVFQTDPLLGVGLVDYRDTIRAHPDIDALSTEDYVVHNAPLFLLASTGVVGVASLLPLAVLLLRRAYRGGVWGLGLLLSTCPVLLLTQQFFVGIGYMWFGVVAGVAALQRTLSRFDQDETPVPRTRRVDESIRFEAGERVTIG